MKPLDCYPTPLDRVLLATDLVRIGAFRAPVDHPLFPDSGPISDPVFVFPRTSVEIRHEGERWFTADPCTVTYYNPGQRYTRRALDPRGDACDWFGLRPDALMEALACADPAVAERPDRPFTFSHSPSDSQTYALQRLIVRHLREAPVPDPLVVEEATLHVLARLLELLPLVWRVSGQAPARRGEGSLARGVRTHLLRHLGETMSLEEIAGAVGCSVFHLCRVFRRETGTTVHRYRQQLRLRRSLELVAQGRADLSRVAFELGFSSHSHFSSAFAGTFSMTPSEFRRQASSRRIRELASQLELPVAG